MKRYANYLAGVGYAVIFGFSFLFTKGALEMLDPFELLFARFALAALSMSAIAATGVIRVDFRGKLRGFFSKLPRQSEALEAATDRPTDTVNAEPSADPARTSASIRPRQALLDLSLACLFQPLLYFTAETFGVRDSTSSTAGVVLGALPACVAVLGVFMLKEKLTTRQTVSLGLSILGVAVIALWGGAAGGESGSLGGFLLLIGALASATFYNIFSRRSSRVFSPFETTFAMMWTGAIVFGITAMARGAASGRLADLIPRAASAWVGILYLGILSSVVAFFFINFTLSRLKASQSVVFASLTTVVAVAAGVLLRGEAFGPAQAIGAAMIVLGVWGTNAAPLRYRKAGKKP